MMKLKPSSLLWSAACALLTACEPAAPSAVQADAGPSASRADAGPPQADAGPPQADAGEQRPAAANSAPQPKATVRQGAWGYLLQPAQAAPDAPLSEEERLRVGELEQHLPNLEAMALLAAHGKGLAPSLERLLTHADPSKREAAVRLIGVLDLTALHPRLVEMHKDSDVRVRRAAIAVIDRHVERLDTASLLTLVTQEDDQSVQIMAIRALSERGERGLVEPLRLATKDTKNVWRLRSLEGLARVALPQDAPWFEQQLGADLGGLSTAARTALWRGLAADPSRAVALWRRSPPKADEGGVRPELEQHAVMRALAPYLPEDAVVAEFDAREGEAKGAERFRDLARALAVTPGQKAEQRMQGLWTSGRYVCDLVGARLELEATLEERIRRYEGVAAAPPPGTDVAALRRAIEADKLQLARVQPLAKDAGERLAAWLKAGKRPCRAEAAEVRLERLEPVVALLKEPAPDARLAAARFLGRDPRWAHVGALAGLLRDADAEVRRAGRDGLTRLTGLDLRSREGYLWESWYMRSFGPLPAPAFPVGEPDLARLSDFEADRKVRPLPSEPINSPEEAGQVGAGGGGPM